MLETFFVNTSQRLLNEPTSVSPQPLISFFRFPTKQNLAVFAKSKTEKWICLSCHFVVIIKKNLYHKIQSMFFLPLVPAWKEASDSSSERLCMKRRKIKVKLISHFLKLGVCSWWTCNPEDPSSTFPLTARWILVVGSPEFKSLITLVQVAN